MRSGSGSGLGSGLGEQPAHRDADVGLLLGEDIARDGHTHEKLDPLVSAEVTARIVLGAAHLVLLLLLGRRLGLHLHLHRPGVDSDEERRHMAQLAAVRARVRGKGWG